MMKLLAFLVITALCIVKVQSFIPAAAVTPLINVAIEMGAPFREPTIQRIKNQIWGKEGGRGSRSTDVILFNKSKKDFKLVDNSCKSGGFSSKLFPEHIIPKETSSAYGVVSNGLMTGVKCTLTYRANDKSYFEVTTSNPYFGKNKSRASSSNSLSVFSTLGVRNNNEVRYIIEDA